MNYKGIIFGLTGPSGVGKGFIKEHIKKQLPNLEELTVATTRGRREADGKDRDTDISIGVFLERAKGGTIIFAHQPFGTDGDWYGFYADQIKKLLIEGREILTEIHVDNVRLFKSEFGQSVKIIGLMAEESYLETNLNNRMTESGEERRNRLAMALNEIETIKQLKEEGLVDSLIEVQSENRETVAQLTFERIRELGIGEVRSFRSGKEHE